MGCSSMAAAHDVFAADYDMSGVKYRAPAVIASGAMCIVVMLTLSVHAKDITTGQTGGHAWSFPVPAVVVHFEGVPVTVTGSPGMGNSS